MNNANRSPCAGSSGEISIHVAIDTITDASDAVKHTFESCCLSIFLSCVETTLLLESTPDRIRTCDRPLRRRMLYPAELRVQR